MMKSNKKNVYSTVVCSVFTNIFKIFSNHTLPDCHKEAIFLTVESIKVYCFQTLFRIVPIFCDIQGL